MIKKGENKASAQVRRVLHLHSFLNPQLAVTGCAVNAHLYRERA